MCRSSECDLYWVSTQIAQVARVDQVGQHEVDEPVVAAERDGRLGAVRGQRPQPLSFAARENDPEDAGVRAAWIVTLTCGCASGSADPGVSAGRLRRRRRARRLPRPRAAPAGRRRRALLRRAAGRRGRRTQPPAGLAGANAALQTLGVDLEIAEAVAGCDVLHSHTWYANVAGVLGGLLHGVPHVLTAHSLEPQRPWKVEQLGGGYRVSLLGRAHRVPQRRRGDRGQPRHEGRRAGGLPVHGPGQGARGPQRHRHRALPARPRAPTCWSGTASTRTGRTWSSSAGSPGRRASGTCSRPPAPFVPEAQLVLCAGAPDTAGDRRGDRGRGRGAAGAAVRASSGSPRCCPGRTWSQLLTARDRLRLPVGVRAAGHRQPGGDGLRDRGGGLRGRRHPRGRRRRGDRDAGAVHGDRTRRASRRALADAVNALVDRPGRGPPRWAAPAGPGRSREFGWDAVARRTLEVYGSLR